MFEIKWINCITSHIFIFIYAFIYQQHQFAFVCLASLWWLPLRLIVEWPLCWITMSALILKKVTWKIHLSICHLILYLYVHCSRMTPVSCCTLTRCAQWRPSAAQPNTHLCVPWLLSATSTVRGHWTCGTLTGATSNPHPFTLIEETVLF